MLPEINGKSLDVSPDKIALICDQQRITYGELDLRVQQIANALPKNGHKIAICAKNSINYVALYLACRRTNNIAVMINYRLPVSQQESLIEQAGATLVFRDQELADIELVDGDMNYTCDTTKPCLYLFTSGSSGEPKIVVITNGNRQNSTIYIHTVDPHAVSNPRILATPMYHMNAISTLETVLDNCGTLVIQPEFDDLEFIKLVSKYRINRLSMIPSMLAKLVNRPDMDRYNFDFVRVIVTATSPLTQKLYDRARKVFSNAAIKSRYGLTEFGHAFGRAPDGIEEPALSCGYPISSVQYKIVNEILYLKSQSMSLSYLNSDLSKIEEGWLNTGDRFRVDENGFYFHLGRVDDMRKVNGEQVFPNEIETTLETVSGIEQACVILIEDDVKGYAPYAFCVGVFDEDTVKTALAESLSKYKIPQRIWMIDSMPLIGIGKVDKNKLIEQAKELL